MVPHITAFVTESLGQEGQIGMVTRELLGQRLRQQRLKARLTQDDVARRMGLERTAISRMESGRQGIDIMQFVQLLGILDCGPEDLLGDSVTVPAGIPGRRPQSEPVHSSDKRHQD